MPTLLGWQRFMQNDHVASRDAVQESAHPLLAKTATWGETTRSAAQDTHTRSWRSQAPFGLGQNEPAACESPSDKQQMKRRASLIQWPEPTNEPLMKFMRQVGEAGSQQILFYMDMCAGNSS